MKENIKRSLTNLITDLNNIVSEPKYIDKLDNLASVFRRAIESRYRIFFTGVGKTSYAADKLAATAKSIGINAEYLDCQNAGHGDIGAISTTKKSFIIYMSKSGKTEEHFKLAGLVKERRPNCMNIMFCFASDEHAELMRKDELKKYNMDAIINLPLDILESDNLGIVPTNSNALFEACISAAMISAGLEDTVGMFSALERNHPSGSLHNKVSKWLEENA